MTTKSLAQSLVMAASFGTSGIAIGQDVDIAGEKKAPFRSLLPNSYSNLEMEYNVHRKMKDDTVTRTIPFVDLNATLGTKIFDEKLDTSFVWIMRKNADTAAIKRAYFYNYTTYKLYKGSNASVMPYAETYFDGGNFTDSHLGAYADVFTKVDTGVGEFEFKGYVQPSGVFSSNEKASKKTEEVRNETGIPDDRFSLGAEGEEQQTKTQPRDPWMRNYTAAQVTYTPNALRGFSIRLRSELERRWKPDYKAVQVAGATEVQQDGYNVSDLTRSYVKGSYKISDTLTIANEVIHYTGGFYQVGYDAEKGARWTNELSLTAKLF